MTQFKIGDRVSPILDLKNLTGHEQEREWLGGEVDGVLSTHIFFHEEKLVKLPEHLSWAEGACLPNAGVTGWSALAGLGEGFDGGGRTILVQGKLEFVVLFLLILRSDLKIGGIPLADTQQEQEASPSYP